MCHGVFINMYSAVVPGNEYDYTDTPQFRWGNLYVFSEKLYQSVSFIYASMYREKVQAIHAVCKKMCNKNRQPAAKAQNRSFTSRGATVGLGLRPD